MRKLITYYYLILKLKLNFLLYAGKFKLGFWTRLNHDNWLLNPKLAKQIADIMYNNDGSYKIVDYDTYKAYQTIVKPYRLKYYYYLDTWVHLKLTSVPNEYLNEFIADRYIRCGRNLKALQVANRDLFAGRTELNLYEIFIHHKMLEFFGASNLAQIPEF